MACDHPSKEYLSKRPFLRPLYFLYMLKKILLFICLLVCFSCREDEESKTNIEEVPGAVDVPLISEEKVDVDDLPEDEEIKFDKEKWNFSTGGEFPYRQKMLNDIVRSRMLKGLKLEEVTGLLGEPARIDNNYLFYPVAKKKVVFFVLSSKTLVLQLTEEGVVGPVLIHG